MKERQVLASCIKSRDAWNAVADHVQPDEFSEQGSIIFDTINAYYTRDSSCHTCDVDVLASQVSGKVSEKHRDMFSGLVTELAAVETSPANVIDDFLGHRRELARQELASALLSNDEGAVEEKLSKYEALLSQSDLEDDGPRVERGTPVRDLVEDNFDPRHLIPILPESLNKRLEGGVKRGHHVVLFARPEMGKTMTVINMIAGFLQQDLTVLYIGNEDPLPDIQMRVINRLTGMTRQEVMADPDKAQELAEQYNYDSLILASMAPGTVREVTQLMEDWKPDVLVLDQLRNLNMRQDNFVRALEQAAQTARAWAKGYNCVVVSVTQAGDSASGKSLLDLGDVDNSNTGIPATADLMLGIGATEAHATRGEIVFSLPKNKVSGWHGSVTVQTQPQLSQLISYGD